MMINIRYDDEYENESQPPTHGPTNPKVQPELFWGLGEWSGGYVSIVISDSDSQMSIPFGRFVSNSFRSSVRSGEIEFRFVILFGNQSFEFSTKLFLEWRIEDVPVPVVRFRIWELHLEARIEIEYVLT